MSNVDGWPGISWPSSGWCSPTETADIVWEPNRWWLDHHLCLFKPQFFDVFCWLYIYIYILCNSVIYTLCILFTNNLFIMLLSKALRSAVSNLDILPTLKTPRPRCSMEATPLSHSRRQWNQWAAATANPCWLMITRDYNIQYTSIYYRLIRSLPHSTHAAPKFGGIWVKDQDLDIAWLVMDLPEMGERRINGHA